MLVVEVVVLLGSDRIGRSSNNSKKATNHRIGSIVVVGVVIRETTIMPLFWKKDNGCSNKVSKRIAAAVIP